MSLINWIFDIYQHSQITQARDESTNLRRELASLKQNGSSGSVNGDNLERAMGELALATRTVQRMLVDKGICSHEEFASKLREVDLEDGRADGRLPL